jgi:predicted dehydrogenase
MCEKPLATTLEDAQAIIDVCREAGVILMTAFPMRFSTPLQQVKERLDSGDLGQVYCLNTTNQGRMPIKERAWFVDKELAGGGAIMDHTVHLADIMRWYTGREVVEVYAQANRIMHADKVDVETGGLLMLTFSDGTFATIDASWSKPLNYPTWGGLTMEIISERGLTIVDPFSQNLNRFVQDPPGNAWHYWGSDANQAMVDEFVNAIREGRRPKVTGEDGYKALEITLAAYESAGSGQPVSL